MARLTRLEKELAVRALRLVLADEWPWDEGDDSKKALRKYEQERAAVLSAIEKLES